VTLGKPSLLLELHLPSNRPSPPINSRGSPTLSEDDTGYYQYQEMAPPHRRPPPAAVDVASARKDKPVDLTSDSDSDEDEDAPDSADQEYRRPNVKQEESITRHGNTDSEDESDDESEDDGPAGVRIVRKKRQINSRDAGADFADPRDAPDEDDGDESDSSDEIQEITRREWDVPRPVG